MSRTKATSLALLLSAFVFAASPAYAAPEGIDPELWPEVCEFYENGINECLNGEHDARTCLGVLWRWAVDAQCWRLWFA